jgi:cytochrome c biogenesis protein CcmG/thiol:disulfide interchange protein DsbE
MPRQFAMVAIIVIVVGIIIGFIAMKPEPFTGSDDKKTANTEKIPEKAGSSQVNNEASGSRLAAEDGVTVGKRLPEFVLATPQGKEIKVAAGGQPLVLNFWATWCPPCRQEMPELEKFSRQYSDKATFYAINIQESGDKITEFITRNQYSLQVLADKDGTVARSFRVNAIPTTLVIDKQGIIKFRKAGTVTLAELEGVLNGL